MTADLTYAIGDVHGRLDLLHRAYDAISEHSAGRSLRVIMLGDYIDRGPQSKQVIEFLRGIEKTDPVTCLRGNHEAMMVDVFFNRTRSNIRWWADNGGEETIESYGGEYGWGKPSFFPFIPHDHIEWMESLPTTCEFNGRLFVHAGFMPGVPLHEQEEETTLWIRDKFLNAEKDFKDWAYIVHGHTPQEAGKAVDKAWVLDWRCNLDSAAFHTGVLTVGVFEGVNGAPVELLYVTEDGYTVEKAVIS